MTWKFERRVEHAYREKRLRLRVSTTIDRIWTSSDGHYSIFNTPGCKTFSAQCNRYPYFELGERIRSLARAKALCETNWKNTDWPAWDQEERELHQRWRNGDY